MLNTLRFIYPIFGNFLQGTYLLVINDQLDWTILSLAYFNSGAFVADNFFKLIYRILGSYDPSCNILLLVLIWITFVSLVCSLCAKNIDTTFISETTFVSTLLLE